jgi:dihydrofolate synthase/folylpolyglutamate synthase
VSVQGPGDYGMALARLRALAPLGVRPGLEAIGVALARLGHPEAQYPALHIAGTNGKGSTAALAAAMLAAAGARVGLYTSPHLSRYTERIRIAGAPLDQEIDQDQVPGLVDRVLGLGLDLTFFEATTAMAFLAFAEAGVDIAVVECGLGGRFDATNLCRPVATAITSIGFDHTELLGPTLAAIAGEKAGIAKPGVPLVLGPVAEEAKAVIAERAAAVEAPLLRHGTEFEAVLGEEGLDYRGPGGTLTRAPLALTGPHQAVNAALALALTAFAPERFRPDEAARRAGLLGARWPGRLERLAPDLWLDAAHNPDGARALARALPSVVGRKVVLLVGVLGDKDVEGILRPLLGLASRVVATRPSSPRALPADQLAQKVNRLVPMIPIAVADDPADALVLARSLARPEMPVVACGSIYLVGALRRLVTGEAADPVAVTDPLPAPR